MARVFPSVMDSDTKSVAEKKLYNAFTDSLDDSWVVFHNVKWIGYDREGRPRDGEADFVVAHPDLGILVIEVKGGNIHFDATTGHFISVDRHRVPHDIKDPFEQAMVSKHALISKMRALPGWGRDRVFLGHMVAFPDCVVDAEWLRPSAPRAIILDHNDITLLSLDECLHKAFAFWQGENSVSHSPGERKISMLIRLLGGARSIRNPLLSEHARVDQRALVQLTETQYRYLRFMRGQRRAAIAGCAGSGKTLLAVEKARCLAQEGLSVLLTCYNRLLANHLGGALGYRKRFDVFDFHQLCVHWIKRAGFQVPQRLSTSHDYFSTTLPEALLKAIDVIGTQYDAIIVDEGQDFRREWWEVLPFLMHDPDNGIFYVLYDDNQRLYADRTYSSLIHTLPYVLNENCRNTQRIFDAVSHFYEGEELPIVLGPKGQEVSVIPYEGPWEVERKLRQVLHHLFNKSGFQRDEVAVLSGLGERTSTILGKKLGNFQLTDQWPLSANQVFATTIRRFKGLERTAIVLCELDRRLSFDEYETLMYVGMSRARAYMVLLIGKDAPQAMFDALFGPGYRFADDKV